MFIFIIFFFFSSAYAACSDVCVLKNEKNGQTCSFWNSNLKQWVIPKRESLHNKSRMYTQWLRKYMLPAGGIQSPKFKDTTYQEIQSYSNINDSAIWTGVYLAAESFRYLETSSIDALEEILTLIDTLDIYFNISGDKGYLARYVASKKQAQDTAIKNIFKQGKKPHYNFDYHGIKYHWLGQTSRDQYQGPILGFVIAYKALNKALSYHPQYTTKILNAQEKIRFNTINVAEALAQTTTKRTYIHLKNLPDLGDMILEEFKIAKVLVKDLEIEIITKDYYDVKYPYTIFANSELKHEDKLILNLNFKHIEHTTINGIREFIPDYKYVLSQIPIKIRFRIKYHIGASRKTFTITLSDLAQKALKPGQGNKLMQRSGSAIMVAAIFEAALMVSKDNPRYLQRYYALKAFYEREIGALLDIANQWEHLESCGKGYFGIHITYLPLYILAQLNHNYYHADFIQNNILQTLWNETKDDKNVLFAYIYAANMPESPYIKEVIQYHTQQLQQFPPPPRIFTYHQLQYPKDPKCPENALQAINIKDRAPEVYLWQHHPWTLKQQGDDTIIFPGVDYLIAYWLGRYHGFIQEDVAEQCLRWR